MRALGLDLSLTATGWATSLDEYGVYRTTAKGVERLEELYEWLMHTTLSDTETGRVDLAVIEGYAYGKGNQAHQVGEWGGVARLTLHQTGVPYAVITPPTLKKFATGRGNATKSDMRVALLQRTGMDIRDDNAVDALWLLAAAHQATGDPLWEMPRVNVEALGKVEWPR